MHLGISQSMLDNRASGVSNGTAGEAPNVRDECSLSKGEFDLAGLQTYQTAYHQQLKSTQIGLQVILVVFRPPRRMVVYDGNSSTPAW